VPGSALRVDAAETRIRDVNGRDVCLVRRFDRYSENGRICRRGFLSARSVFFDDPAFAAVGTGSYPRLARWMPRLARASTTGGNSSAASHST
jgi:hypothetical protein